MDKQEYLNIAESFKQDNSFWKHELPDLLNDYGEFPLYGGFDYSYFIYYESDELHHIDLQIKHRMTSDRYVRYFKDGRSLEMADEIARILKLNYFTEDEFRSVLRVNNVEFNFEYNKLFKTEFDINEFEFFWENNSPFSQWYKVNFELNGTTYTSAEQFMMAKKAELFNDIETKQKILSTNNTRKQKNFGRQVKNFDETIWNANKIKIVYMANNLKFSQNIALKEKLMNTTGKLIVEASPVDKIWGIGLAEDNPDIYDKSKWEGENLLGKILTQLRNDYEFSNTTHNILYIS